MNKTKIFVIYGKAATGKDTFAKAIKKKLGDKVNLVVSATTRPMRPGEVDGEDYIFLKKSDFLSAIVCGYFLEYKEFNGWYYGILKNSIKKGTTNIVVVDPSAAKKMNYYNRHPTDVTHIFFYLRAPLITRIRRYLNREGKFSFELIRRFVTDWFDFLNINNGIYGIYPHFIVDDNDFDDYVDTAVNIAENL